MCSKSILKTLKNISFSIKIWANNPWERVFLKFFKFYSRFSNVKPDLLFNSVGKHQPLILLIHLLSEFEFYFLPIIQNICRKFESSLFEWNSIYYFVSQTIFKIESCVNYIKVKMLTQNEPIDSLIMPSNRRVPIDLWTYLHRCASQLSSSSQNRSLNFDLFSLVSSINCSRLRSLICIIIRKILISNKFELSLDFGLRKSKCLLWKCLF
jgi:hypothetical protein